MKYKFISIFILVFILISNNVVYAEDAVNDKESAKMYVNNVLVDTPAFLVSENYAYMPLRAVFENLGKTVEWVPESKEIIVDERIRLRMEQMLPPVIRGEDNFEILNLLSGFDLKYERPVQFQDWTIWCSYSIKDDTIYINSDSMMYLIDNFGSYDITFNKDKQEVYVNNIN